MRPSDDSLNHNMKHKIDVCSEQYFYETDFARLKPFLLAKGRYHTAQHILKNINDVVYVNTDGFIITNQPDKSIKFGLNIGDLKLVEHCNNSEVFNSNKVVGFEKHSHDPFKDLENDSKTSLK
jgi:hypothetical protein